MNKDKIKVNDHTYSVALNEQTQMYARKLRGLYQQGYSDVDSFDEVSSEISTTVNNLLKRSVSPEVREEDMDGVIQHLLKAVDKAKKNVGEGRAIQLLVRDVADLEVREDHQAREPLKRNIRAINL